MLFYFNNPFLWNESLCSFFFFSIIYIVPILVQLPFILFGLKHPSKPNLIIQGSSTSKIQRRISNPIVISPIVGTFLADHWASVTNLLTNKNKPSKHQNIILYMTVKNKYKTKSKKKVYTFICYGNVYGSKLHHHTYHL